MELKEEEMETVRTYSQTERVVRGNRVQRSFCCLSLFFSFFFKAIKTMVCLTLIVINLVKNKKLTVVGKRE